MAYSYLDVLNAASNSSLVQNDAKGAVIMDRVNSLIHAAADWRWTLKTLPPFFVIPLVQDYVAPFVVIPPDFEGLRWADLVYNGTEPATRYPPLTVDRYLPLTSSQARPTAVSYEASISGFRLHPRPPSGIGPMDYQIEGTYKIQPTTVTAATLMNLLPSSDRFFNVWVDGCHWVSKRQPADMQVFLASLAGMAEAEAVDLGTQSIAPAEPLVGW